MNAKAHHNSYLLHFILAHVTNERLLFAHRDDFRASAYPSRPNVIHTLISLAFGADPGMWPIRLLEGLRSRTSRALVWRVRKADLSD